MMRKLLITVVALVSVTTCQVTEVCAAEEGKKGSAGPGTIKSVDKAGKAHVTKGYRAMKAAPGAKKFAADPKLKTGKLPPKVDLRGKMTKIEDQGETSSCVANAVAGSYEYWVKRATEQDYDVSRLFVYYNARLRNGDEDKDEGSIIQFAMEGLKEFGACSEDRWPFSKALLLEQPNRDAYKEADKFKVKEMAQVPLELEAWKQALASGYPIVFGCLLFESFDQCNQRGGVVPMPSPEDVGRQSHGGHSMCAVGYSDKEQVFIVRNSWGDKWGDQGYCYMPYNYLLNPNFNGGDSWVFIPETPIVNPEDTWFEDDEPVTDGGRGVDFVITTYTVDDYKDVKVTWWEEETVAYDATPDEEFVEFVEIVEQDNWEAIESFEEEQLIAEWEAEYPGEDDSLYVYDEDDVLVEDQWEEDAEEEAAAEEEADDQDADGEISEDEVDDEGADEEVSGEDGEEMEEDTGEEVDEDVSGDDGEAMEEEADEAADEEISEDDGEVMEEEAEEEVAEEEEVYEEEAEEVDESGYEEAEEESYEDDGGDDAGYDGGGDDGGGDDGGGDDGGGDE